MRQLLYWNKYILPLTAAALLSACGPAATTKPTQDEIVTAKAQPAEQIPVDPQIQAAHDKALSAMMNQHYEMAIQIFEGIINTTPQYQAPYINLGLALKKAGRIDDAKAAYQQALKINSANAEAYNQLALLHREQGQFDEAKATYEAGLAQAPENPSLNLNLGILYDIYLAQPEKALLYYQKFEKASPDTEVPVKLWISDIQQRLK